MYLFFDFFTELQTSLDNDYGFNPEGNNKIEQQTQLIYCFRVQTKRRIFCDNTFFIFRKLNLGCYFSRRET